MHDNIILDSSIIAAIFLPEQVTEAAIQLAADHTCTTVDLAYAEVANVAWKRVVHTGADPDLIQKCLDDGISFIRDTCDVIPGDTVVSRAWNLACHHRITVYDALFVAAAVRCNAPLATTDRKLADRIRETYPVIVPG